MKVKDSAGKMNPPKILIYGDAGSGKTAFATTLGGRLEIIDIDQGIRTALMLKDKWTDERGEVELKTAYENDPSKAIAFDLVESYVNTAVGECMVRKFPFRALCVDSWTTLAEMAVRKVLAQNNMLGKNPQIQHWGMAFTLLEGLLLKLRSLPIVVVLTAHIQRLEEDGVSKVVIATPGQKLPAKVPAYFDEIWRLKTRNAAGGKKEFIIQTISSESVMARSRGCLVDGTSVDLGLVEVLRRIGYDIDEAPGAPGAGAPKKELESKAAVRPEGASTPKDQTTSTLKGQGV